MFIHKPSYEHGFKIILYELAKRIYIAIKRSYLLLIANIVAFLLGALKYGGQWGQNQNQFYQIPHKIYTARRAYGTNYGI